MDFRLKGMDSITTFNTDTAGSNHASPVVWPVYPEYVFIERRWESFSQNRGRREIRTVQKLSCNECPPPLPLLNQTYHPFSLFLSAPRIGEDPLPQIKQTLSVFPCPRTRLKAA